VRRLLQHLRRSQPCLVKRTHIDTETNPRRAS
jgi:hypothetical protein